MAGSGSGAGTTPGVSSAGTSVSDTAYDATSWNGVTDVAPSKNAVRDKIESLASGGNDYLFVMGITSPTAQTNWSTVTFSSSRYFACELDSTGAQNASVEWDVQTQAGTFTLDLFHVAYSDVGIYTVTIDGVSIGTIDGYNGAPTNSKSSITGVALTAGRHRVKFTMATKNASASSYKGYMNGWSLTRTGA